MLVCPNCGADDLIEGDDQCDVCQQPLTDLFIRVPECSVEASLLRDQVGELPVHPPVYVEPSTTVGDALRLMVDNGIGCVLVVAPDGRGGERLAGIFSERDAVVRFGAEAAAAHDKPISRYMTANPAVVSASDKIAFAIQKMDVGGYRHLPVMEDAKPVSLISIRDILRYLTERAAAATG
ncbi:putative cystathionine beta-synthase [Pseudobythopirellula maris]|uniref:Putative cystathionine beta-synthase n=1 Tax=Pseudobythopirellula maris TaxID=2527991 RepID=A0A5C5ZPR1_9BACT|nr:CBS domain-containing protein [Pseudobythopirellula maris]TWT88897.1 putative cystathionine beta-synthase [Pseudobythopirellula maris]